MDELEIYKGLREIAVKQLEELKKKGSMNPAEAEAAKIGMCIIDMVDDRYGPQINEKYSERYSRHGEYDRPFRRYNITSYGMYDDSYRGMSRRGSYENQNRDSMGRYSSHSIDDRVVDMLEKMVDTAQSDFEYQKLMEYIRYVRSKEMGE